MKSIKAGLNGYRPRIAVPITFAIRDGDKVAHTGQVFSGMAGTTGGDACCTGLVD